MTEIINFIKLVTVPVLKSEILDLEKFIWWLSGKIAKVYVNIDYLPLSVVTRENNFCNLPYDTLSSPKAIITFRSTTFRSIVGLKAGYGIKIIKVYC